MNHQKKIRRRFLGKTENFKSKEERNFEKAHLKAYLKGKTMFRHGFESGMHGLKMPKYHRTKQELYLSDDSIAT